MTTYWGGCDDRSLFPLYSFLYISLYSETLVPKDDCGPGKISEYWDLGNSVPKKAMIMKGDAFSDLVPGRAYNMSVATASESLVSDPLKGSSAEKDIIFE